MISSRLQTTRMTLYHSKLHNPGAYDNYDAGFRCGTTTGREKERSEYEDGTSVIKVYWCMYALCICGLLNRTSRPVIVLAATLNDAGGAAIFNGVVDSIQAILCSITAPLLGSLGDKIGRIPILRISVQFCISVEALALLLIVYFRLSLPRLFLSNLLIAISESAITSLIAAIADLVRTREARTRAFARLVAAEGESITLAPLLGRLIVAILVTKSLALKVGNSVYDRFGRHCMECGTI